MVKRKFKINVFDGFVVAVIALACLICVIAVNNRPNLGSKNVLVEVVVSDPETIKNVSDKIPNTKTVFWSSTKYPVQQINKVMQYSPNETTMHLTFKGPGEIVENNSIFNGQRVFLNQKVEIRSDYFLQGRVVKIYYEN